MTNSKEQKIPQYVLRFYGKTELKNNTLLSSPRFSELIKSKTFVFYPQQLSAFLYRQYNYY
jgi:hypothetical protein